MDNTNLLGGVKAIFAAFKQYAPALQAAYAQAAKTAITNVASNYQQLFKQFQTQVLPKLRTQQAITDADLALSEKLKKESEGIQASADFEQLKSAAEQVIAAMSKFAAQLAPASNPIAEDAPVATRAAFYAPLPPPPPDNFPIAKSVGKGGANDPKDVRTVQKLLNQRGIKTPILAPLASLDAAGLKELIGAIEHLQKNVLKLPIKSIDGIVAKKGVVWLFLETGLIATDAKEVAKLNQFSQNLDTAKKLYGAYIIEASQLFGIPEMEIYSTMGAEVAENIADPTIANAGGASGLMQVTSGTWEGVLNKGNKERFLKLFVNPQTGEANWELFQSWKNFASSKSDPQANIFVGTAVLKEKKMGIPNMHPDIQKSIITTRAAYNIGQGAVNEMIRLAGSNDPDIFLEWEYFQPALKGFKPYSESTDKLTSDERIENKFHEKNQYLPKAEAFAKIYTAKEKTAALLGANIEPQQAEIQTLPTPTPNEQLKPNEQPKPKIQGANSIFSGNGKIPMDWGVQIMTTTKVDGFMRGYASAIGQKIELGKFGNDTIYFIAGFTTLAAAEKVLAVVQKDYPNAFIIRTKDNKRVE